MAAVPVEKVVLRHGPLLAKRSLAMLSFRADEAQGCLHQAADQLHKLFL